MAYTFLNFNEEKAEVMAFGPSIPCASHPPDLGSLASYITPTFSNLGLKLERPQLVQNAAVRLLAGTHMRECTTLTLAFLHVHWPAIHFRVLFKMILFAFKSLNATPHITSLHT